MTGAWREFFKILKRLLRGLLAVPLALVFPLLAIPARFSRRPVDIGLGPEPLINNIYHKKALLAAGYSAETFVSHLYYLTADFDIQRVSRSPVLHFFNSAVLAARALFRYKALYIYFNGGPLTGVGLAALEPLIYRLAGLKILVMPYGGDCQDLTLCPNQLFIQTMNQDYPAYVRRRRAVNRRLDRWTRWADHIISGCDWVDYTPRRDSLCLAHFAVDTNVLTPPDDSYPVNNGPVTILHAPNHEAIKGTRFFIQAVAELRSEGYPVELRLVRKMPNAELRELIRRADIIADQLIIGWYAMFALEGLSAGKPVLCRLRPDLMELYEFAGLVEPGEIPIVNCDHRTVKAEIRKLLENRELMAALGRAGRAYAVRHHSLEAIGGLFDQANRRLGLRDSAKKTIQK